MIMGCDVESTLLGSMFEKAYEENPSKFLRVYMILIYGGNGGLERATTYNMEG